MINFANSKTKLEGERYGRNIDYINYPSVWYLLNIAKNYDAVMSHMGE